jgi:iron complex outermembrane receptor protein
MRSLPLVLLALCTGTAAAQTDILDLSIEELANINVTSVSRKPERLADAAASVYVITAEDIRRAGVDSLPEALRLAPNLQVAQSHGTAYAVTARGLNGSRNSGPNKLLVLVDGRSVYSPLFSGTFWDAQETVLEDIARIEVISGPAGVLWGVNAVNAVINIITKTPDETQGSLAALHAGNQRRSLSVRHGAGDWRGYARMLQQSNTELGTGLPVNDERRFGMAGFKGEFERGADHFRIQGDLYDGRYQQPKPGLITVTGTNVQLGDVETMGANLTGQWTRSLDGGAALSVQAYLDHSERTVPPSFSERLDIFDVQLLHTMAASGAHQPTWGLSHRVARDRVRNSDIVAFLPAELTQSWTSVFAQDDIRLADALQLTAGARIERNPYTSTEFLPNLRLGWKAGPDTLLWGGVSRTVRAPSRLDVDVFIPGRAPHLLRGGPVVKAEVAKVFEVGYRGRPADKLSLSVTLFHNRYDHMRTQELAPTKNFVIFGSGMEGKATGLEAWGNAQLSQSWRMSAGVTGLRERFWSKPGSNDTVSPLTSGRDPRYQLQLRSQHALGAGVELDLAVRKVAPLVNQAVPGYTALDARLGWRLAPRWELSLVGQNLNGAHAEYGPAATRSEIPRSLAVRLTYR